MEALRWGLQPLLSGRQGQGELWTEQGFPGSGVLGDHGRGGGSSEASSGAAEARTPGPGPLEWGGRRVLGWLGALRPSKLLGFGFCREMTGSEVSLFLSLQPEDHSLTLS